MSLKSFYEMFLCYLPGLELGRFLSCEVCATTMSEDLTPRYRGECGHCSYVAHSLESMQEHLDVHSQNDEEHGAHLNRISDPVESDSDSEVCIRPDPDSETESEAEWHEWSDNTPHPFEFHQETFQNSQGSDLHLGTCDTDYVHRRLRVESDMTSKPENTESSCFIKQESDVEEVADELGTSPGFTAEEDTLEVTQNADSDVNKIVESEVGEPEPHIKSQPGLKEKVGKTSCYYCAHCDFESADLVLVQKHTMDEHTAVRQEDDSPHCDTEIYENQCEMPPECPWWYETDHTYCQPPPCHTIQAVIIERPEGEPPRIIVRQTPVQFNKMISDSEETDTAESNDSSWVLEKDEEAEGDGDKKKEVYDDTNGYLCTFHGCGATYGLRADFCSHVIAYHTRHGAQLYYCAYCKFVAVEAESVSLHTAKMHQKEKNFFGNLKSGSLSLPEELSNSLMKETEEGFQCQVCQYETEFRDVIILHAWRAHRATMVNKLEKSLPGFTQVVEKKGILKVISALLITKELFAVEKNVLPSQELRPIVAPNKKGKSNTQARMLSLLKRENPYPQTCIKSVKRRKRRIMNDVCVGCAVCNNFAAKRKRCKKSNNECVDNSEPVSTDAGSSSNVISDGPQDKQEGRPHTRRSRRNTNREPFYNENKTTRTDPTPISAAICNDQEQNRRKTLDIEKLMASIQCDEAMAVAEVQFRGGQRTTEGVASTAGLPRLPSPDESTSVELQNGLPTFLMLPIVPKAIKGLGRMPTERKGQESELGTAKPGELLRSLAAVLKLANGKANVIMQITCTHLCTSHKVIKSQQTRGDKVVIFHQSGDNVTHSEVLVPQQTLHTASVLATIDNNEWCLKNASRRQGQQRMKAKVNVGSEQADGDGERSVLPKPPSDSTLRRLLAAGTLNEPSLLKKKGTPFREVNTTPAKAVLDDHTANGCHDTGSDDTEISFRRLRDINTGANLKSAASSNLKSKQTNQRKTKKKEKKLLKKDMQSSDRKGKFETMKSNQQLKQLGRGYHRPSAVSGRRGKFTKPKQKVKQLASGHLVHSAGIQPRRVSTRERKPNIKCFCDDCMNAKLLQQIRMLQPAENPSEIPQDPKLLMKAVVVLPDIHSLLTR